MADLELRIGQVKLKDFELPENFGPLGGEQMVAMHQMIGGRRVVQTFGPIPHTLTWEGILLGADAFQRSRVLDRLRSEGAEQIITYGAWRFRGIVKHYDGRPHHQYNIPYKIEILTIQDITSSSPGTPLVSNEALFKQTAVQVLNNITALQASPPTGFSLATLASAASAVQGFSDALRTAGGLFTNMQTTALNANVGSITTLVATLAATAGEQNATGIATTFLDSVSAAEDLANQLRFLNFLAKPPAKQPRILYVVNPNLFALATQYYGDPVYWTKISTPNNLYDPQPIGKYRLLIPV